MQILSSVFSVMMTNRMLNYRMLSGVVSSISGLSGQDSGPGHDSCQRAWGSRAGPDRQPARARNTRHVTADTSALLTQSCLPQSTV